MGWGGWVYLLALCSLTLGLTLGLVACCAQIVVTDLTSARDADGTLADITSCTTRNLLAGGQRVPCGAAE